MAVNRATKTLTLDAGQAITKESYAAEDVAATNYGTLSLISIGGNFGTNAHHAYISFALPSAPSDADQSQSYKGILAIRLKLRHYANNGAPTNPTDVLFSRLSPAESWAELTMTWNNRPLVETQLSVTSVPTTGLPAFRTFDLTILRAFGIKWGDTADVQARYTPDNQSAKYFEFYTRDGTLTGDMPVLEVDYAQTPPVQITDLKIAADPNDDTRPVLTWSSSKDPTFSKYQVFRKVGAGAYAQVGSDITVQGQNAYVDTAGGLTENNVIYYKVRESNVDGSWNESNEVWMIRPDVSTFTVDDTTPDVNQKITATIAAVAYGTTPTPVTNTDYYYEWGSGSEYDQGYALVKDLARTHIWPAAGSQTPKCQIRNSQGFRSDKTSLTTGGPTLTVASIAPVAKLKAAPMVQLTNTDVRFYGDESYAPAVNKTINVANGYEWDQDYVAGPFVADFTTTLPYKDVQWASAGTKRLALRVKDQDGTYSPVVTIDLDIIASVVVNLDNLVDGFDILDHDEARQTFAYEGVDATEIAQAGKRIHSVTIGGFAFTDVNADNVPDDVATLKDVIDNLKKVQLTVLNVVRTGMLRSGLKVHTEGGWALKYNWTVDIALDP